jgi:hypothetical protein
MAVTVNLREVFPSDSQSNLTEKLNFNFNQLLTLGLGEPGGKGDKGDPGGPGPVGPAGGPGQRGAIVISKIDTSTPTESQNAQDVVDTIDGDLFINAEKIFAKGVTVSGDWEEIVNFPSLINSQALQDSFKVFQLGTGDGDSTSRHAKFLRYVGADKNNSSGLPSSHPQDFDAADGNATQLVLTNFDELKTYRISAGSLVANSTESDDIFEYTALQKIVAYLPSVYANYRHQLELGSVDDLNITVGGASQQFVLTPSEQNLKLRKYRVSSTLIGGSYNRAELDLSGLNSSANSLNGEIVLAVNKKVLTRTDLFEMGLTTGPILGFRVPSFPLNVDGLFLTRDGSGTSHIAFGFDTNTPSIARLSTTPDLINFDIKDSRFSFAGGNLTISQTDPNTTSGFGTAVVVRNNRLAQGLAFPATAVLSSDPNTLDDYEEGTWTPVMETVNTMVFGSDNNGGNNYQTTNAAGRYVKIGRFVFITFQIDVRFILDTGVAVTQGALDLGFTSVNVATYGSETYGMRLSGLPNIATETAVIFDIEMKAIGETNPTLRSETLNAQVDQGQTMTTVDIEPIVPGSVFGRYYCQGIQNPTPRIELLGNRYILNSSRVSPITSRVQPHDFLKVFTTAANQFTRIHGSGWILEAGACVSGETQSELIGTTTSPPN